MTNTKTYWMRIGDGWQREKKSHEIVRHAVVAAESDWNLVCILLLEQWARFCFKRTLQHEIYRVVNWIRRLPTVFASCDVLCRCVAYKWCQINLDRVDVNRWVRERRDLDTEPPRVSSRPSETTKEHAKQRAEEEGKLTHRQTSPTAAERQMARKMRRKRIKEQARQMSDKFLR